jgi:Skp family chaperone for outer membrane proteins
MQGRRFVVAVGVLCAIVGAVAGAQELRTVAVFDSDEVVLAFYQESSLYRDYNRRLEQFRAERQRLESRLEDYQQRRQDALDAGNATTARRLREDIEELQDELLTLDESWRAESSERIDELAGDDFYERLIDVVGYLAENGGYTLVIDWSREQLGVIWYSEDIDITQDIIEELIARNR